MAREKSYGAVVFRRDKDLQYLILQYGAGHWDLVKGHGERGESEEETVLRELREETGITRATFIPGFREEIHYFFQRRGRTVYKEVVYYLIETPEKQVILSDEHVAYQWLPYTEALRAITFGNSKRLVEQAHEHLAALRSRKSG
ncbi:bis(5'-nucleosyl)-tetraphosphatase [Methanoculleus sp. 7T]|jgi:bis(5'-nucleosidyl)-tetraphosphatase|uniref:bis(5'-nucleosyl)-tetraphosphatase n=1 Tax=Methanoculleus sp. 7T TaxID=2937282 RepID=UPI0020C08BA3|nr:NUDIX domain-containing protein [Methanoculleus sp. 7T]MCK8518672.1 NUDIX domain-containing protein [Methanoculleus sp. 7T]